MTPFWIGISGMPGQSSIGLGKTTLARDLLHTLQQTLLIQHRVKRVGIIPFATGVRHVANVALNPSLVLLSDYDRKRRIVELLPSSHENPWQYERRADEMNFANDILQQADSIRPKMNGQKPRQLYQFIGHEGRLRIRPTIWIDYTQALRMHYNYDIVIADDVRYDNEVGAIDFHVAIDESFNPGGVDSNRAGLSAEYLNDNHPSENSLTIPAKCRISPRWSQQDVNELVIYILASME